MRHATTKPHNVSFSNFDFNVASLQSLGPGVKYEDPRFQLNLVQKKELPSERPVIQSTKCERLAYYRAFTSTQSKTEIVTSHQQHINIFLWLYAFNVLFKSFPHGFVHYFLAAYAPEEHLFVSKMVPLGYGLKYLFVFVGFLEMISCVDLMVVMFHYTSYGIIAKNPWNRCKNKTYFDEKYNLKIICYEIQEFAEMFINKSHLLVGHFYVNNDTSEYFQVSQVTYYREQMDHIANSWDISNFLVIWGFVQILQMHAWKRYFWKALHYSQWGINFVDLCALAYLLIAHYDSMDPEPPIRRTQEQKLSILDESDFWTTDVAMLAESVTAPPVVHVLTSRSTQEIDPTTDSASMVISNAFIYIFRGILSVRVKVYCEALIHTEMHDPPFNEKSWFYLWPMFWQEFYFGDIFSILYTVFNMLCESLILVVTNLCITETVVYEWSSLKRWQVTLVSTLVGIFFHCCTTVDHYAEMGSFLASHWSVFLLFRVPYLERKERNPYRIITLSVFQSVQTLFLKNTVKTRAILWIYGKGVASLAEIFFLYLCYPVGRLMDDYTFHYGVAPTQLKMLNIRFVPIYYTVKIYLMLNSLWLVMRTESVGEDNSHYIWSWSLMLIPVIVGIVMTIFRYIVIHTAPWSYVIRPLPKWGPRDFSVRQLRKQFDSRFYIDSGVPRLLSRYLLSKKETKVYKVDVRYDYQKRSAPSKVGFGEFNDDKKEKIS